MLKNKGKACDSARAPICARPREASRCASSSQVAEAMGCTPRIVQLWARRYGCPHTTEGRALRFDLAEVRAWRAQRAPAPRRGASGGRRRGVGRREIAQLAARVDRLRAAVDRLAAVQEGDRS